MDVCLVRCPSAFLIDERAFPPLGLLAVGAGLKQQGHDVTVFDGELEELPLDYRFYGFGPTAPEYPHALGAMQRIKEANPTARVILGGPHAILNYLQCGQDGWDSIVVGDGEYAAEEAFLGHRSLIFAEPLPLDNYPFPDRTLVDLRSYRFTLNLRPATTIMSSRGCPFHCGYCCKNEKKVRLRSATKVIEEIQVLERMGWNALAFPEDIFIMNKARTEAICDYLKTRDIIWRCLVRADLVVKYGRDFLQMMIDAGCVGVGVGVESGSDRILKIIQKGETVATMREAIAMLREARLYVKGFFIVGLPGENEESLAETDRFLAEVQLNDIDCKIYQPYPGSPIYDHKERYDIEWDDIPLENTFYKGRPSEYYGNVRTSALTTEQIVEAWKELERKYKNYDLVTGGVMCQT